MTANPLVQIETIQDGVACITLNRPEKRNALSQALMRELCEAVATVEKTSARVLILRGAGPVFCAGLDLKETSQTHDATDSAQLVGQMLQAVYESPLISIAVVQGAAAAGGAGLMSACDFVVAERGAVIGYPEVHRGLVAALVSGLVCAQVSRQAARELLVLGELIDTDRAMAIGLVSRVVDEGAGHNTALDLAQRVLKGGPEAVVTTKQLVNNFHGATFRDELAKAMDSHLSMRRSEEAREGLAAFLEKREPNWRR